MSGWIKIHRSILDHWLYKEKRVFSKLEAWNDILLMVNYSDARTLIKGRVYEVKRGQSILSLDSWATRWRWSKSMTRRFLSLLEKDEMIELKSDNITTHITICKYDDYQGERNADETQVKFKRNTSEIQTTPIEERKEKKEEKRKKEITITKISDEILECYEYCKNFFPQRFIPDNQKKENQWLDTIRLLVEVDGYDLEAIKFIVEKTRNDEFWSNNFLSLPKLRKKDKNDIMYIDIFTVKFIKNGEQQHTADKATEFSRENNF